MAENTVEYTAKDLKSDQEVRWCPGCGDHAILNSVQRAIPQLGIKKENLTFISGIGCSSRFPYYMNTYGMHSIHGRASAIASGVKVANPKLSVWQITGDGDALAIGGNHFIHIIRRNIDVNIILFNNEIYGLTKGQYSPTSQQGAVTKTSPFGTVERPFHPGELVMGARGTFFARSIDSNLKLSQEIFIEAARHNGTSVVEVLQNCVIYNDRTHGYVTDKENKENRQIVLRHGEKMIFGKNKDKGIMLQGLQLKIVEIGKDGITEDDILVHDEKMKDPGLHMMLVNMKAPDYPIALGVIRNVDIETYDQLIARQIENIQRESKVKCLDDLFRDGSTWEVK